VRRREFISILGGAAVGWPLATHAQLPAKVYRIGILRVGPPPPSFIEPFRKGLRELGYIEGQNLTIEYGLANSAAQLPGIAAELVRLKVDLLVASGTPSVIPARDAANTTTPVVFVAAIDPVAAGVATSLARPGGNVTGLSAVHGDVTGKRLQILTELLPNLSRIAFLVRATSPATAQYVKEAELAAQTLRIELQILTVRDPTELESALSSAHSASALLVVDDAVFTAQRARIAELALNNRLPTISGLRETVDAGGLMSYGPDYGDMYRRAATHVYKILNGTKAADLAIEQPTKFELVINLKTAKALGLTVPPSLLARADEVIE
jgi:putative tryptophan/tyrosine transport system substrate-binding protein